MKLLLVTATAIAVFTVDCRDFSSDLEGQGTDSEVQIFQEDIEEQGKRQTNPDGPHGSNLDENQNSDYNDQQMKEEKKEQHQSPLRSTCETKLDQMEVTINNIYAILVSQYNPEAVCSEASGFFKVPKSGNRCYKLFTDSTRSWQASKAKCQDEGLLLAKPEDPVALRTYLVENFGNKEVWVGGRGTGSSRGSGTVQWTRDGSTLSSSSSAWWPGQPGSYTSTSYCLEILAYQSYMDRYPTKPYYMRPCTDSRWYALCEVAM